MAVIARAIDAFVRAGFAEDDARSRLHLIEAVSERHRAMAAVAPDWCWFVPGRIEIFGKHTDYAGGRSLLAAVPRGFVVAASPRSDDVVRVSDVRAGETRALRLSEAAEIQPGWLNYVAAVVRRLSLNFPGGSLATDLTIASDLPRASGLSSSSALVVGVATALIRRGGLEDRPEWRAAISSAFDLAGYLGALERGAAFGALAGTEAVGVFGGSEDHTAILTCQAGQVSACRFIPVEAVGQAAMPDDWSFVIASSGVVADKAGSARDLYNRASLASEELLALWNAATGASRVALAHALTTPEAIVRLRGLIAAAPPGPFAPDILARRLDHFLAEDRRIPAALSAFQRADAGALGALSAASQRDAEALLQNQTAETSALAALAREEGALAACSFGAGFGGSVWALVRARDAAAFGERWAVTYRARFPDRRDAAWFTARPAPALVECAI